jgi:hypothetical protein
LASWSAAALLLQDRLPLLRVLLLLLVQMQVLPLLPTLLRYLLLQVVVPELQVLLLQLPSKQQRC